MSIDSVILKRAEILQKAKKDKSLQEALKIQCTDDIYSWIENFVWIYEPRHKDRKIPMSLEGNFAYQKRIIDKLLECIISGKDLRIEKSRDVGMSWLVLVVFVWGWQFKGWDFVVGSKNADSVDKLNNLKTLLPKARFILASQPKWLLPRGFNLDKNAMWMNIVNPEKANSLSGEANSPTFATGTRAKAILFDEFSKWEHTDREAWTSAGAATPCRIAVSTPMYKNNKFYDLKGSGIEELKVHYSENRAKTGAWLAKEKEKYTEQEWAQEMEIDYSGTAHAIVFAEELAYVREHGGFTEVLYIPSHPVYISMDLGIGDLTVLLCFQKTRLGEEYRLFETYQNSNKDIFHYIEWLKSPDRGWNKNINGSYHEGWRDVVLVPDPNQASNRELTSGKSTFQILEEHEFVVETNWIGEQEGISLAKKVLRKTKVHADLLEFIEALEGWHYAYDESRKEYKRSPYHDRFSHHCKALCYFAGFAESISPVYAKEAVVEVIDYSGVTSAGI